MHNNAKVIRRSLLTIEATRESTPPEPAVPPDGWLTFCADHGARTPSGKFMEMARWLVPLSLTPPSLLAA